MIEIIKGDDYRYNLSIKIENEVANVSSFQFTLQIRPSSNNDTIVFENDSSNTDTSKVAEGIIIFTIPKEITINFNFSNAALGVFYIDASDLKKLLLLRKKLKS